MNKITLITIAAALLVASCGNKQPKFDASGSFEAAETIISAEVAGTIKAFNVDEGQTLAINEPIGYIDSTQLYLKKKQVLAQINALQSKQPDVSVQTASLKEQLKTAEKEKVRITMLVKTEAATTKQLDDVNANIEVIKKQIDAQRSTLNISSEGIDRDITTLEVQVEQLNDQLTKCRLVNPIGGTVLTKYAEANELTNPGKALYKIADLTNMILRVYISGDQLPGVKINQKVKVFTDNGKDGFKETEGVITWINEKAEFTPKTIQTKAERANMVYAIKVKVKNDGAYKIGMYGEIKF